LKRYVICTHLHSVCVLNIFDHHFCDVYYFFCFVDDPLLILSTFIYRSLEVCDILRRRLVLVLKLETTNESVLVFSFAILLFPRCLRWKHLGG
jgi:hypothetical protein